MMSTRLSLKSRRAVGILLSVCVVGTQMTALAAPFVDQAPATTASPHVLDFDTSQAALARHLIGAPLSNAPASSRATTPAVPSPSQAPPALSPTPTAPAAAVQ